MSIKIKHLKVGDVVIPAPKHAHRFDVDNFPLTVEWIDLKHGTAQTEEDVDGHGWYLMDGSYEVLIVERDGKKVEKITQHESGDFTYLFLEDGEVQRFAFDAEWWHSADLTARIGGDYPVLYEAEVETPVFEVGDKVRVREGGTSISGHAADSTAVHTVEVVSGTGNIYLDRLVDDEGYIYDPTSLVHAPEPVETGVPEIGRTVRLTTEDGETYTVEVTLNDKYHWGKDCTFIASHPTNYGRFWVGTYEEGWSHEVEAPYYVTSWEYVEEPEPVTPKSRETFTSSLGFQGNTLKVSVQRKTAYFGVKGSDGTLRNIIISAEDAKTIAKMIDTHVD